MPEELRRWKYKSSAGLTSLDSILEFGAGKLKLAQRAQDLQNPNYIWRWKYKSPAGLT